MEPWYKPVTPPRKVREGRSLNPHEFACEDNDDIRSVQALFGHTDINTQ